MSRHQLALSDVAAAQRRISGGVYRSPCPESIPLSEVCGFRVYCKLEYLQRTGSFKERGARNALMLLSGEQRRQGVIAASAGNHALGLAYHGKLLGVPVTVVMPRFAPLIKAKTCRSLGARVVLHGDNFPECRSYAARQAEKEQLTFIHPFDDPAVIAGQGTIGLEILDQVPDIEAIVVPVGGGGLIAGVALAVKPQRPEVEIAGVEPAHAPSLTAAMEYGRPADCQLLPTLADGLAVSRVGKHPFAIAKDRVDRVVTVSEGDLALAVLRLAELEKAVVEGAGAAPLAAALSGKLGFLRGKKAALVLAGGNIDLTILSRVIERGLVSDGRLSRFTASISDRPGSLAQFASLVASTGASIKEVVHDRAFSGADLSAVNILCVVETNDGAHSAEVHEKLRREGVHIVVHDPDQTPGA